MNRSSSLSVVKLRAAAAILVAVPALAAAGCGEKDEPPTTGPVVAQTTTGPGTTTTGGNQGQQATDDEEIKATVVDFLTKPNAPGACTKLVTPQFVKRSYGDVKGCEGGSEALSDGEGRDDHADQRGHGHHGHREAEGRSVRQRDPRGHADQSRRPVDDRQDQLERQGRPVAFSLARPSGSIKRAEKGRTGAGTCGADQTWVAQALLYDVETTHVSDGRS